MCPFRDGDYDPWIEVSHVGDMRNRFRVTRPSRTRRILAALATMGGMAGAAMSADGPAAVAVGTLAGLAAGSSLGIGSLLLLLHTPVARH